MKVLFAVSNENISESIVKKYQRDFKEIISYKNVYYFNAILKELQKNKTYDRIVISEDLEPFSNNNYDAIDKFIFDKMDSISDEASDNSGNDIPIILICADRRAKTESMLVKLFGIGVYSALIGQDRSIENVCELIKKPRTKKEAKTYYRIDADNVNYQTENENDVSETEIQNILAHYKKLGKNEEKYAESFENIASQYNDVQLKLICNFLPLNVKAILEETSPKYQKLVTTAGLSNRQSGRTGKTNKAESEKPRSGIRVDPIRGGSQALSKPVVIPSAVNKQNVKKLTKKTQLNSPEFESDIEEGTSIPQTQNISNEMMQAFNDQKIEDTAFEDLNNDLGSDSVLPGFDDNMDDLVEQKGTTIASLDFEEETNNNPKIGSSLSLEDIDDLVEELEEGNKDVQEIIEQPIKRGRGRPRKAVQEPVEQKPKRGRGRPKKVVQETAEENMVDSDEEDVELPGFEDLEDLNQDLENDSRLPGFDNEVEDDSTLPGFDDDDDIGLPGFDEEDDFDLPEEDDDDSLLPGFDDEEDDFTLPSFDEEEIELPGFDEEDQNFNTIRSSSQKSKIEENPTLPNFDDEQINNVYNQINNRSVNPIKEESNDNEQEDEYSNVIQPSTINRVTNDLNTLLTKDKKVVAFIGTSKNGTSFLINNVAVQLSLAGIKTAILDLTQNHNSYYVYTNNEEQLRTIASQSIQKLNSGIAEGLKVNKNLSVYTAIPGEEKSLGDANKILSTLIENDSLVLIDCDFETNLGFLSRVQEIYLVQSMDVLTIQPLTAFLRDLKAKNILDQEKIRVVLNKSLKVKGLSPKVIIGGMSFYNDPAMSYMTELFDRDHVKYCEIPFEEQTYSKYLEGLLNCEISLNGYSKNFLNSLKELANMVYPLIGGNGSYKPANYNTKSNNKFSSKMNNTLDQMKNNY